ncbi:MAG TPA: glycosyltransferase family 39 protein [Thermoanaerobaculia bacterium]|nr:glycosyltransferase family 39 protein [Thermoanaerobaculia bacterium]
MSPSPRAARLALLAAVLLFLALALFGARVHWVEEAGTAERDGYVTQAEQILHGSLPRDPFRPLLYPILTAGLALVTGNAFVAARLISNLAAAALAWQCWAFGRRLGGTACGAWAMALAAANQNLWILGQHVSTDMLFAALAAGGLLAGFCYLEEPRLSTALFGGALLGLATFTRSNAVFLVPPLLAAWWLAPGEKRRRLAHLAAAAGLAILVLVPHWALRQAVFGDPFHDENWKNLAWKLHGYPDWSYLDRVPFSGGLAVVRDDPAGVVRGGFAELGRFFFGGGASQLFGTWVHVLLLAVGIGMLLCNRQRRRPALWLLGSCGLFLVAIAFVFFTWGRLLLFLIPPVYALGFVPAETASLRRAVNALAAALVLLLAVKTFGFRLPDFSRHHPYREVAALRRLDPTLPPGAALAGTSPFLGRYLGHTYVDLPDAFGPEIADPRLWFARVEPLVRRAHVVYIVAGATDLRDRPAALLQAGDPVPWLHLVEERDGVAVWQVR